jgi:hypothetical protein
LPAPFGPSKPVTRPGSATKDTSSTTLTPRYSLVSPQASIRPRGRWPAGTGWPAYGSMRAYINDGLEATAPGVAIVLTIAGSVFAPIGAALANEAAIDWSHLRHLPGR